jgi:hypothetical protein
VSNHDDYHTIAFDVDGKRLLIRMDRLNDGWLVTTRTLGEAATVWKYATPYEALEAVYDSIALHFVQKVADKVEAYGRSQ